MSLYKTKLIGNIKNWCFGTNKVNKFANGLTIVEFKLAQ